jgi:hypothetical protein
MRAPKSPSQILTDINQHAYSTVNSYVESLESRRYSSKNTNSLFNLDFNNKLSAGFIGLGLASFACVVAFPVAVPVVGAAAMINVMTGSLVGSIASFVGARIASAVSKHNMEKRIDTLKEVLFEYGIPSRANVSQLDDLSKNKMVELMSLPTKELKELNKSFKAHSMIEKLREKFNPSSDNNNNLKIS